MQGYILGEWPAAARGAHYSLAHSLGRMSHLAATPTCPRCSTNRRAPAGPQSSTRGHPLALMAAPTGGHQLALRAAPGCTHWPSWQHQPEGTSWPSEQHPGAPTGPHGITSQRAPSFPVFRSACSRPLISAPVVLEVVVPQSYSTPNTIIMACTSRPDSHHPRTTSPLYSLLDYLPTLIPSIISRLKFHTLWTGRIATKIDKV